MRTLQAEQDNQVQILNGTAAVSVFRFPFGESRSLEKSGKAGDPGSSLPKAQVRRPTEQSKTGPADDGVRGFFVRGKTAAALWDECRGFCFPEQNRR